MDKKIIAGLKILRDPDGETGKVVLLCAPVAPTLIEREEFTGLLAEGLSEYIEALEAVRKQSKESLI